MINRTGLFAIALSCVALFSVPSGAEDLHLLKKGTIDPRRQDVLATTRDGEEASCLAINDGLGSRKKASVYVLLYTPTGTKRINSTLSEHSILSFKPSEFDATHYIIRAGTGVTCERKIPGTNEELPFLRLGYGPVAHIVDVRDESLMLGVYNTVANRTMKFTWSVFNAATNELLVTKDFMIPKSSFGTVGDLNVDLQGNTKVIVEVRTTSLIMPFAAYTISKSE